MSEFFLYLTTTGRKTGLPRQIEIWFVEHAGRHYVVSERREESQWVKNIQQNVCVHFSVGPRADPAAAVASQAARARVVRESEESDLARQVRALMDAKYGWSDGLIVEVAREDAPA